MIAEKTFLITGGTGLVGRRLTELLLASGHGVKHLSRTPRSDGQVKTFLWNVAESYVDPEALDGVDVVVHLAGAAIVDNQWSDARRKELLNSRVETLNLLKRALVGNPHRVRTLISASAQGYYEPSQSRVLREDDAPEAGFLGQLCVAWEAAATSWGENDVRVVINRIGLVLSNQGGLLKAISGPLKKRMSAVFGTGSQIYSWIHVNDLCKMIMFQADDESVHGIFNAAAPNPVSQSELSRAIATKMGQSVLALRAPKFLLHAVMGDRSGVLVNSFNLSSDKIQGAGYDFQYKTISQALADLLE